MIIFVQDSRNKMLYPTHKKDWAEKLVKQGKAKWIRRKVVTLQLNYPVNQEPNDQLSYFVIGMDPGYKNIGYKLLKITGTNGKILIGGTCFLRTEKIKELNANRDMYRHAKRHNARDNKNSNKRHVPRWRNRSKTKSKMNPTKRYLLNCHLRVIEMLGKLVPAEKTSINLEYNKFDMQQISKNKNPSGAEYDNMKCFIRARDKHTCQHCGKSNCILEVHHKIQRKDGGTNKANNLITLCKKCHKEHHNGKINVNGINPNQFRHTSTLNQVMKLVYNELAKNYPVYKYRGYETDIRRKELGLPKTHENDALVISMFGLEIEQIIDYNLSKDFIQFRRHNRSRTVRYEDRGYYLTRILKKDGSYTLKDRVASNRNKRSGQGDKDSLFEYKKKNPRVLVYAGRGRAVSKKNYSAVKYRPGDLVRDLDGKIHVIQCWGSTQCLIITNTGLKLKYREIVKIRKTSGYV